MMLPEHIPLNTRSRIAWGAKEPGGSGEVKEKGTGPHRFPRRGIAFHDIEESLLSLSEAGRMGDENVKAGTQPHGVTDRHALMDALASSFRRDFMKQGPRLIQRCNSDRSLPEQRVGQAGEGNFKRWNGKADDVAIHDRTISDCGMW